MVMKVYVVYQEADDNYFVDWLAIFSTYDKAQSYIDKLRSYYSEADFKLLHSGIDIEEFEVDEMP